MNNRVGNCGAGCGIGIEIRYSPGTTISGNRVENGGYYALSIDHSENCVVSANILTSSWRGITMISSGGCVFKHNIMNFNYYNFSVWGTELSHFVLTADTTNLVNGRPIIYLIGENNVVINQDNSVGYLGLVNVENIRAENLQLSNNGEIILAVSVRNCVFENITGENCLYGLWGPLPCDNIAVSNCSFRNIYDTGIDLYRSRGCKLQGNTIENALHYGLRLCSSSMATIVKNSILRSGYWAVLLEESDNNTLLSNTLSFNQGGLLLASKSNNNMVLSNMTLSNTFGMAVAYSKSNTIWGNSCASCQWGVYFYHTYNNIVSGNIVNNCDTGMCLEGSEKNLILKNTLENNRNGLYATSSSGNTIYLNLFQTNACQAYDDGSNAWDNGSHGNYWSDWQPPEHPDANGDGIVDEPRPIEGGTNVDHYPLVISPPMNVLSLEAWYQAIDSIPEELFVNQPANRKQALKNKLTAVFNKIAENEYQSAINQLKNDVLEKLNADGKADWVSKPALVTEVQRLIDYLKSKLEAG
jgi:parallel beta-helix repeat protein